jgi:hypothetical protein
MESEFKKESPDVLDAESSAYFQARAMAGERGRPDIVRQFKCTETFMARSGVMMMRDVYLSLPATALTLPNPELYVLGETTENERPAGTLFKGENRKARRAKARKP